MEETENACHDFKFNWTIPDYKNIAGGELSSTLSSLNLKFVFKVTSDSCRKMRIGMWNTGCGLTDLNVFFTFKMCDFRGKTFAQDSTEFKFSQKNPEFYSREITMPTCTEDSHLYYVAIKGRIVLKQCCETEEMNPKSSDDSSIIQLQQDFKQFLKSGETADITLEVDSEQFKVHRFVLCARSPVFRRMLQSDTIENRQSKVTLPDVHSEVLKIFLSFLYTGETGRLSFGETCQLYSIADKYEVLTLQKSCRDILLAHLSNDNVSKILELGDRHSDLELQETATKFICEHFPIFSNFSNWKRLIHTNPLLASRTLQKVSDNMSSLDGALIFKNIFRH